MALALTGDDRVLWDVALAAGAVVVLVVVALLVLMLLFLRDVDVRLGALRDARERARGDRSAASEMAATAAALDGLRQEIRLHDELLARR